VILGNMDDAALEPGLYLVATPIGNLEDITLRALRVLNSCDLVAAEDTRHARKLLNHFSISVKTISYREQNAAAATPQIVADIISGKSVALVSDAGMPCISDPGAELVAECDRHGLLINVIPGPSAVVTAVARSGMSGDKFIFAGFPPPKQGKRQQFFEQYKSSAIPLVYYEAPHRILASLRDALAVLGNRQVSLQRELTKLHEEVIGDSLQGTIDNLSRREAIKGEFVVMIAAAEEIELEDLSDQQLQDQYQELVEDGLKPNAALKQLVVATGRDRQELYHLLRSKNGGSE
jgi:16S rRNA (cytidine1402-2'-O)-methyltransferase